MPGPGDRALVPAGVQTRLFRSLKVGSIEHDGDLEVTGPEARLETFRGGATDRLHRLFLRGGGQMVLGNSAIVTGPLLAEGGTAEFGRPAVLQAVRLIGEPSPGRLPRTRLTGSSPLEPLRIEGSVSLEGPTNSAILLSAAIQFLGAEVTWGACSVLQTANGLGLPGRVVFGNTEGRPVSLRLQGGDAQTQWVLEGDSLVRFEPQSGVQHGPGLHTLEGGRIEFAPGSLGVEPGGGSDGPLLIQGSRVRIVAAADLLTRPPVLSGPLRFSGESVVTLERQPGTLPEIPAAELGRISPRNLNEPSELRAVTWSGRARAEVQAPVLLLNIAVEQNARFELLTSLEPERLGSIVIDDERPPVLRLRGGQFLMPSPGHPLILPPGSVCELGQSDEPADGLRINPTFRGHLVVEGRLEVVGGTQAATQTLALFNGLLENRGRATFRTGHGLHRSTLFWNGRDGSLILGRPPENAPSLPAYSPLGGTFINEGFVEVPDQTGIEVVQGTCLPSSHLTLHARSLLRVVGKGDRGSVALPDGRILELNHMFNLRAGMDLETLPGAHLEVTGEGAYGPFFRGGPFQDDPGGLHTEVPLEFAQVSFGGDADQKPRISFGSGDYPEGIGLRITRRLGWFGGVFIGNGTGDTPSTAQVELAAGALGTVTQPENPFQGGPASLGGGITFELRGELSLTTDRPFSCDDLNSRFVFHPGSVVTLSRMTAFDMNTARIVNRTTVRKVSANPAHLSGLWLNESGGQLLVEEGNIIVREGILGGGGYGLHPSFEFRLDNATLRNFSGEVGMVTVFNPSRFSGRVELDHLMIGNGFSSNTLLRGDPDTTLSVKHSFQWSNGGIDLGENSRLELAEGSRNRFAVPAGFRGANAGIFESGQIINRGEITITGRRDSNFLFESPGSLENLGVVTFETRDNLHLLGGDLAGQPGGFSFINRGLVLLAQIANGEIKAEFAALYVGLENSAVKVLPLDEAPRSLGHSGSARAPLNLPNLGQVIFTDDFTLNAGECDFRNCNVRFTERVTLTGGRLVGGNNGEVHFASTFNFNGGELRLEGTAIGRFGRVTTIRNGRLFLDADATLEALPGFNLRDGSVLSGKGRTTGSVAALDSIIAPGVNGPDHVGTDNGVLTIGAEVSFNAGSRLILDVPLSRVGQVSDALRVGGKATLGGTLQVNPQAPPVGELVTGPIPAVAFGTVQGDFTTFTTRPFRDGLTLDRRIRGAPENDLVLTVVSDVSANLALTAEIPLAVPVGGELDCRYTVDNLGPEEAPTPSLEVVVPPQATLISSTPAGTLTGDRLVIELGPLLTAASRTTVQIRLRAPGSPTALPLSATVSSPRPDFVLDNNTVRGTTAVLVGGKPTLERLGLRPDGRLKLRFETQSGVRYRLEHSFDLKDWQLVREVAGDGTPQESEALGTPDSPSEFFRLVLVGSTQG